MSVVNLNEPPPRPSRGAEDLTDIANERPGESHRRKDGHYE
jgi:hypothetical protein